MERRLHKVETDVLTKEATANQITLFSAIYDKASAYANLIVVAGYAGFFGLWSLTQPYVSKQSALWAALFMGASMVIFVFFEIAKMVIATVVTKHASETFLNFREDAYPADKYNRQVEVFKAVNARWNLWLARYWPWALIPTIALGAVGAGILLFSFVVGIVNAAA